MHTNKREQKRSVTPKCMKAWKIILAPMCGAPREKKARTQGHGPLPPPPKTATGHIVGMFAYYSKWISIYSEKTSSFF